MTPTAESRQRRVQAPRVVRCEPQVLRHDARVVKTLPMPRDLVREMVADWMGAGRAITGRWEAAEWYLANAQKMLLHYET